jgi:hypothetical protein
VVITDPATWALCKGVDIKESHAELWTVRNSQQHSANLVVFPSRLPQPSISSRAVCHLLFGRLLASSVCVCFISQTNHPTPLSFYLHHTPIITRAIHEPFHRKPCQPPNLLLSFYPPSLTTHAPTWCRGNLPSTGQRAAYSLNGTPLGSCSPSATTLSGLSSTPPLGVMRARPDFPIGACCPCCRR